MSWVRFLRRRRWDEERSAEIEAYLEAETAENLARGMSIEDARHAACRKFGNPIRIREEIYHMNTIAWLETFWQDLRYGARMLRLNPAFAAVAILSLALGIGANTAIFQLLDALRLRSLPVSNPQDLAEVQIANLNGMGRGNFYTYPALTNQMWEQIRQRQQGFSGMLAWGGTAFGLTNGGEVRYARGLWVSGDFFNVLGVQPILGRVFTTADDRRGCGTPGAVISYGFWKSEFGGDPAIIGRKITLSAHPVEVIGVTPASFFGLVVGRSFDAALPICSEPVISGYDMVGTDWWLQVMGRRKPGWTVAKSSAQLNAISSALFADSLPANYPPVSIKSYLGFKLEAVPGGAGSSYLREMYADPLGLLLAIAGLVLLIACANLANLMLARATAREREIAVRLALGASRGRILRQLLAESLMLAVAGGAAGAFLAVTMSRFLVAFLSTDRSPLFVDLHPDWRVLAFTAGVSVLTCILFGLTPAWKAAQTNPGAAIKAGGRGLTTNRERFGLRRALVGCQVALSLVLLVGALLFSRSLSNLLSIDAGFRQTGILLASVDFSRLQVAPERRYAFQQELIDRLAALPGVDSASESELIPLSGDTTDNHVWKDGDDPHRGITSNFHRVGPGFFRTLGIALLTGRDFDRRDTPGSPRTAVVNEEFARKMGLGANPIGQQFRRESTPTEMEMAFTIVGLVKNSKYRDLREAPSPIAYLAISQEKAPDAGANIFVHSSLSTGAVLSSVKQTLAQVNPAISVDFRVFATQIRSGLMREQLMATLSGFFGFLAVLLAVVGLYGVISYMVARRVNEIGIRIALGASRRSVIGLILREASGVVAAGLITGMVIALLAGKAAASMLYGLKPSDPLTFLMAMGGLGAVAAAASYLPARRAARLEPMAALREE